MLAAVTASDQTISSPFVQGGSSQATVEAALVDAPRRSPLSHDAHVPLATLRGRPDFRIPRRRFAHVGRKIEEFLNLANLNDFVVRSGAAQRPVDRFLLGFHVDHPVAAEYFL